MGPHSPLGEVVCVYCANKSEGLFTKASELFFVSSGMSSVETQDISQDDALRLQLDHLGHPWQGDRWYNVGTALRRDGAELRAVGVGSSKAQEGTRTHRDTLNRRFPGKC
ncbi:unnamed protein product [Prorocentrum cordatum]|uniref:Uncharacterized protein n=1 Tax=Prorocentrum cordatum TaxID=2364126 RepID=A0ABN9W0G4_9DINO|nr:unnamed protein product [Polarella glacialis]